MRRGGGEGFGGGGGAGGIHFDSFYFEVKQDVQDFCFKLVMQYLPFPPPPCPPPHSPGPCPQGPAPIPTSYPLHLRACMCCLLPPPSLAPPCNPTLPNCFPDAHHIPASLIVPPSALQARALLRACRTECGVHTPHGCDLTRAETCRWSRRGGARGERRVKEVWGGVNRCGGHTPQGGTWRNVPVVQAGWGSR